jgi:hypothetical protein
MHDGRYATAATTFFGITRTVSDGSDRRLNISSGSDFGYTIQTLLEEN